jgi:hypothetical protein
MQQYYLGADVSKGYADFVILGIVGIVGIGDVLHIFTFMENDKTFHL